jgi:hypothetical protein
MRSTGKAPGEDVADPEPSQGPASVIQKTRKPLTVNQDPAPSRKSARPHHRVIAQPHSRGSVDASQKGADCLPREGAWQLRELVKAWRINLVGQSGGNPVVNGQESKQEWGARFSQVQIAASAVELERRFYLAKMD